MIIENNGFKEQLEGHLQKEETDLRLEEQVDGSIAITDQISNTVILEVREETPKIDIEKPKEENRESAIFYTDHEGQNLISLEKARSKLINTLNQADKQENTTQ